MLAMLGSRAFSLAAGRGNGGLSCDADGVFVGDVPLLKRSEAATGWSVRSIAELNDELTARYRIPIDVAAKANALALIAHALNRDDVAIAAIATVQMQFPDPPPLSKRFESGDEIARRALELHRSGLLKGDWDPTKHPRTGTPPNRAWFAPVPQDPTLPTTNATGPKIPGRGWPRPDVNQVARNLVRLAVKLAARYGVRVILALDPWVDAFLVILTPVELNGGEDRLTAQLRASLQTFPRTLEELQQKPTEDLLGYEQHHIVGQNGNNLAKDVIEKFGRAAIDDPNNIVWLPRFQHEWVSTKYSENSNGPGSPTVREGINEMDFNDQREAGLKILRELGLLK